MPGNLVADGIEFKIKIARKEDPAAWHAHLQKMYMWKTGKWKDSPTKKDVTDIESFKSVKEFTKSCLKYREHHEVSASSEKGMSKEAVLMGELATFRQENLHMLQKNRPESSVVRRRKTSVAACADGNKKTAAAALNQPETKVVNLDMILDDKGKVVDVLQPVVGVSRPSSGQSNQSDQSINLSNLGNKFSTCRKKRGRKTLVELSSGKKYRSLMTPSPSSGSLGSNNSSNGKLPSPTGSGSSGGLMMIDEGVMVLDDGETPSKCESEASTVLNERRRLRFWAYANGVETGDVVVEMNGFKWGRIPSARRRVLLEEVRPLHLKFRRVVCGGGSSSSLSSSSEEYGEMESEENEDVENCVTTVQVKECPVLDHFTQSSNHGRGELDWKQKRLIEKCSTVTYETENMITAQMYDNAQMGYNSSHFNIYPAACFALNEKEDQFHSVVFFDNTVGENPDCCFRRRMTVVTGESCPIVSTCFVSEILSESAPSNCRGISLDDQVFALNGIPFEKVVQEAAKLLLTTDVASSLTEKKSSERDIALLEDAVNSIFENCRPLEITFRRISASVTHDMVFQRRVSANFQRGENATFGFMRGGYTGLNCTGVSAAGEDAAAKIIGVASTIGVSGLHKSWANSADLKVGDVITHLNNKEFRGLSTIEVTHHFENVRPLEIRFKRPAFDFFEVHIPTHVADSNGTERQSFKGFCDQFGFTFAANIVTQVKKNSWAAEHGIAVLDVIEAIVPPINIVQKRQSLTHKDTVYADVVIEKFSYDFLKDVGANDAERLLFLEEMLLVIDGIGSQSVSDDGNCTPTVTPSDGLTTAADGEQVQNTHCKKTAYKGFTMKFKRGRCVSEVQTGQKKSSIGKGRQLAITSSEGGSKASETSSENTAQLLVLSNDTLSYIDTRYSPGAYKHVHFSACCERQHGESLSSSQKDSDEIQSPTPLKEGEHSRFKTINQEFSGKEKGVLEGAIFLHPDGDQLLHDSEKKIVGVLDQEALKKHASHGEEDVKNFAPLKTKGERLKTGDRMVGHGHAPHLGLHAKKAGEDVLQTEKERREVAKEKSEAVLVGSKALAGGGVVKREFPGKEFKGIGIPSKIPSQKGGGDPSLEGVGETTLELKAQKKALLKADIQKDNIKDENWREDWRADGLEGMTEEQYRRKVKRDEHERKKREFQEEQRQEREKKEAELRQKLEEKGYLSEEDMEFLEMSRVLDMDNDGSDGHKFKVRHQSRSSMSAGGFSCASQVSIDPFQEFGNLRKAHDPDPGKETSNFPSDHLRFPEEQFGNEEDYKQQGVLYCQELEEYANFFRTIVVGGATVEAQNLSGNYGTRREAWNTLEFINQVGGLGLLVLNGKILEVSPKSWAYEAGIKIGDQILEINRKSLTHYSHEQQRAFFTVGSPFHPCLFYKPFSLTIACRQVYSLRHLVQNYYEKNEKGLWLRQKEVLGFDRGFTEAILQQKESASEKGLSPSIDGHFGNISGISEGASIQIPIPPIGPGQGQNGGQNDSWMGPNSTIGGPSPSTIVISPSVEGGSSQVLSGSGSQSVGVHSIGNSTGLKSASLATGSSASIVGMSGSILKKTLKSNVKLNTSPSRSQCFRGLEKSFRRRAHMSSRHDLPPTGQRSRFVSRTRRRSVYAFFLFIQTARFRDDMFKVLRSSLLLRRHHM